MRKKFCMGLHGRSILQHSIRILPYPSLSSYHRMAYVAHSTNLSVARTVLAVSWRRTDQVDRFPIVAAVLLQNYRCPRYKAEIQLRWCEYYASGSASVAAIGVLIAHTSIPMM